MSTKAAPIHTEYLGFHIVLDANDIMVTAPDGDIAFFETMSRVRCWVRRKRKELGIGRPR